ncbi:MAG TPA: hypothetical protein GXX75_09395 [Clostridiales bacterium]|nr:hypothetical protein [Clostridiales bacterium]
MRKYKKKELLEIIKTLLQENDAIRTYIQREEEGSIVETLIECQRVGIQIGEKIEEAEGEGTRTVTLLEQYCEMIYQLSMSLENKELFGKLFKKMNDILQEISYSIISDIPEAKKEIIFLPYKASMWDSFESIWIAAKEDADCNVSVIPIPYFDKKSNGTLGQIHYEGNEYPEYVSIISWEEYSLKENHPDIAYIHNPYDNCNNVTSIHPAFYAKELKKYVDTLVYIPYFVTFDNVPEHLCVLPGAMYADKVIVHSEKVKDIYIEEFRKFEEENNCKGIFGDIEEKFLALGSPKLDKIASTIREDVEIPEVWKRFIIKPDGTRKKVVFYNTTLQSLLDGNEAYLKKLQGVLDSFYNKRDDITLLWRPHPLMETTISSMRPKLSGIYKNMVNQFKTRDYGIYDDTADLYRAIAVSDAYYGDWSSIVVMYKMTGKPCMIQNIGVRT